MRVLVCGSRSWDDPDEIRKVLERLPRESVVVHGGARGADRMADTIARSLGLQVEEYKADWGRHGRAAGFVRNRLMIDTKPDLVVAFWDGRSTGTEHTLRLAGRLRIPTETHLP